MTNVTSGFHRDRVVRKVYVRVSAPFLDLETLRGVGKALEYTQASSPFRTPTAGSLQSWDRRVKPRLV